VISTPLWSRHSIAAMRLVYSQFTAPSDSVHCSKRLISLLGATHLSIKLRCALFSLVHSNINSGLPLYSQSTYTRCSNSRLYALLATMNGNSVQDNNNMPTLKDGLVWVKKHLKKRNHDPTPSLVASRFLTLPAELRLQVYEYLRPPHAFPSAYSDLRGTCRQLREEFDHEALKAIRRQYDTKIPHLDNGATVTPLPLLAFSIADVS
jgi:hypothetical protein